jgi:hypothetical protein
MDSSPDKYLDEHGERTDFSFTRPEDSNSSLAGLQEYLSIDTWVQRDIKPADRLLGDLVTTTTRMFLVGSTGLGKTLVALGMACGMASGSGFLHWRAGRPARVLYIDGEMPAELIKSRGAEALGRADGATPPESLFIFAQDTEEEFVSRFPKLGRFAPLNTKRGQDFVKELIGALGGVDVVVFDNVMSLISGDQKDEIPWNETLPLVSELTHMRIGQIWVDHTGHDRGRQYGSSTKAWRFDAVGLMAALPDEQKQEHEVAFTLSFEAPGKARRRTPNNWRDFETTTIRLNDNQWTSEAIRSGIHRSVAKMKPSTKPFYDALMDAFSTSALPGRTTKEVWFAEAARSGAAEAITSEDDYKARDRKRAPFRRALFDLKTLGLIGVNSEEISDLRKR